MKHTPGPWLVTHFPNLQEIQIFTGSGKTSNHTHQNVFVRLPDAKPGKAAEQKANARLIAAAPELLKACKTAIEYMEAFGIEKSEYVWEPLLKAIAKAESNGSD